MSAASVSNVSPPMPILTGVVGDGGLEGNLIGYRPCNNVPSIIPTLLNSLILFNMNSNWIHLSYSLISITADSLWSYKQN